MRTRPGHSSPLGATWDGAGVNFALFSENAEGVELCLFDEGDQETRIRVRENTDQVWHIHLPEVRYGRRIRGSEVKDLAWFRPDGKEMTEEDWTNPHTRCFGLRLSGDAIDEVDEDGRRITDDTFLILVNAHHEPVPFLLPAHRRGVRWEVLVDTRTADVPPRRAPLKGGEAYDLGERTLALLRLSRGRVPRPAPRPDGAG